MELSIIRRETTGAPPNQYNESETITKFEIMDGAPVRGSYLFTLLSPPAMPESELNNLAGETIPIRLFLGGFDLTPTFRDVNKKFSTRYYLNLVLIDEENRRYFKQQVRLSLSPRPLPPARFDYSSQEITIFRIPDVSVLVALPFVLDFYLSSSQN